MQATDIIKSICRPEDIRPDELSGGHWRARRINNMHIHLPPNFSAFESIGLVVDTAVKEGVAVLGVTNYYYHDVYEEYARLAESAGIFPMFGLEVIAQIDELQKQKVRINDPGNPGRMYLCGKGITKFAELSARAEELMTDIRENDRKRMAEMAEKLSDLFCASGIDVRLSDADIVGMVAERHQCSAKTIILQERHIARAFQEKFFEAVEQGGRVEALTRLFGCAPKSGAEDAVGLQGEIRSKCMKAGKPAFVEERFADFDRAYELIVELGGIPCYPTLADGLPEICEYEKDIDKLISEMRANNIHCAEFIPIRNTPEVLEKYVTAMREAGIAVVAGTEHNTLDLLPIDPHCVEGKQVPERVKDIFWEGACIVAGHIFMTLHGECGFVDGRGVPNPAYDDAESRISAFRSLGSAVMNRYFMSKERGAESVDQ